MVFNLYNLNASGPHARQISRRTYTVYTYFIIPISQILFSNGERAGRGEGQGCYSLSVRAFGALVSMKLKFGRMARVFIAPVIESNDFSEKSERECLT